MTVTLQEFNHSNTRTDLPNVKPGHVVKVYQKIVETKGTGKKAETKERVQVFEGLVIGRKGGTGISATITVRKISGGIGVERIFPLNAPTIEKIEIIKITKARRAKLNYMRDRVGKATKPKGELASEEDNKPQEKKVEEKAEDKKEDETKKAEEIKNEKEITTEKEEGTEKIKENKNEKVEDGKEEKSEKEKKDDK